MIEPTKDATQAEINAAILAQLQEMRNEMAAMKNRPSVFGRIAKALWAWRYYIIVFALGMAGGLLIPFVSGRMPNPPVIVRPVSSLQQIVSQSPGDSDKRQAMVTAYRETAGKIYDGTIRDVSVAFAEIRLATPHVSADPAWRETVEALQRYVGNPSGVSEAADKFDAIGRAFEEATP